jgi:hypothetical protein
MYKQVIEGVQRVKVGIVTESPFLPISKAVKRSLEIARKALIE